MTVEIHYVIIPAALLAFLSVLAGGTVGWILFLVLRRIFDSLDKRILAKRRDKHLRSPHYIASQKAKRAERFSDICRQIEFIDNKGA